MPGKLTVDPIAPFPLAPSLRRLPIRRLVSSHRINAFFSFLRPQSLGSQHQAHGHQSHVRHPSTVLAVPLTVPLPSYPIHRSLQLSGSRRPPKGHCTNAPEVAGADKKTNPIPSIHPQRATRVLHAQPRFFSQPAWTQASPRVCRESLGAAGCCLCFMRLLLLLPSFG